MTTFVSKSDLVARRKRFRRRQWLWRLLGLWRLSLTIALAGTLAWLGQLPLWQLKTPEEVQITGNHVLSRQQVLGNLGLSLPKPILLVDPQSIEQRLQTSLPLREARVSRQLFPPALLVQVKERQPVAIAPIGGQPGLIDSTGFWVDSKQYHNLPSPRLAVWGYEMQKSELWRQIHPQIAASPVAINVVDLRRLSNLVLRTELGEVQFGPFGPRFSAQLRQLDRMRAIESRYKPEDIAFIDLRSSQVPVVRLRSITP